MKPVVIFGDNEIAELAQFYFSTDSDVEVAGFCVDKQYRHHQSFCKRPLVDFETVEEHFPPHHFDLFVAVGYRDLNRLREEKAAQSRQKGYRLASYISSRATTFADFSCGDNCFILEDNTIQPFVEIKDNVTLWSGNHIGHHSVIENNVFISSHVVVSGGCTIGENSFLGVNATITDHIKIASHNLIAAGATVTRSTTEYGVYIGVPAKRRPSSNQDQIRL